MCTIRFYQHIVTLVSTSRQMPSIRPNLESLLESIFLPESLLGSFLHRWCSLACCTMIHVEPLWLAFWRAAHYVMYYSKYNKLCYAFSLFTQCWTPLMHEPLTFCWASVYHTLTLPYICWYSPEFIAPSIIASNPGPEAAKQPQTMIQ